MCQRPLALVGLGLGMERRPVEIGAGVANDTRETRLTRPATRLAGERDRTRRRAVVTAVRGEHLVPARVQASHPHRVLVGLRATVREEHDIEITRRALGDEAGRFSAHVDRECRRHGAELGRLFLDRGDEPRVLMTDVDVDELRAEVEVALVVVVPEIRAPGPGDRQGVDQLLRRPRMKDVGAVFGPHGGGVGRLGRLGT